MEDIRIDETQEGRIKINFSHKYLQSKGITMTMIVSDMQVARNLVADVMSDIGYTYQTLETSSFIIDVTFGPVDITFNVYTPHTLTRHPYIFEGEEYDSSLNPIGFIIFPDEFLGGVCECLGCKHARKMYETLRVVPPDSNVPEVLDSSSFNNGYQSDEEDYEDFEDDDFISTPDNQGIIQFDELQLAPKPTLLEPMSIIDEDERNADFEIHEELMRPHNSQKTQTKAKVKSKEPYKPQHVIFEFREIEQVITVAKILAEILDDETSLYSHENRYYLVYDIKDFGDKNYVEDITKDLSAVNVEHGGVRSKLTKYYLAEYGKEIINGNALATLLYYFK